MSRNPLRRANTRPPAPGPAAVPGGAVATGLRPAPARRPADHGAPRRGAGRGAGPRRAIADPRDFEGAGAPPLPRVRTLADAPAEARGARPGARPGLLDTAAGLLTGPGEFVADKAKAVGGWAQTVVGARFRVPAAGPAGAAAAPEAAAEAAAAAPKADVPAKDISRCLQKVDDRRVLERFRRLAILSSDVYYMDTRRVSRKWLWHRFRLRLVTSSTELARSLTGHVTAALELADGMGGALPPLVGVSAVPADAVPAQEHGPAVVDEERLAREAARLSQQAAGPPPKREPRDMAEALRSVECAMQAAQRKATQEAVAYADAADGSWGSVDEDAPPAEEGPNPYLSMLKGAASSGSTAAVSSLAAAVAALNTFRGEDEEAAAAGDADGPSPFPLAWYVLDDEAGEERTFVIQGSDSADDWKTNLTFSPVEFEGVPGVHVHRGHYDVALEMYDRFLPVVLEHLARGPRQRIVFTGHSLGGSVGTMLALMMVARGAIEPEQVRDVVTVGGPSVFCEVCSGCGCSIHGGHSCSCGPAGARAGGVLQRLGFRDEQVKNIALTHDIVPRAFACDYSPAAPILRRLNKSFHEVSTLRGDNGNRIVMFAPIGTTMVLQPSQELKFVTYEKDHPMLPPGHGLYRIGDEEQPSAVVGFFAEIMEGLAPADPARAGGEEPDRAATQAEATGEYLNSPHPLEVLADPGAYGDDGQISRYHNPRSYALGLTRLANDRGW